MMMSAAKPTKDIDASPKDLAVKVLGCDMPEEMREAIVAICVDAVAGGESESKMASSIKRKCDELYPETKWHCLVGRAYGSYFTCDPGSFLHVHIGKEVIILFRATDSVKNEHENWATFVTGGVSIIFVGAVSSAAAGAAAMVRQRRRRQLHSDDKIACDDIEIGDDNTQQSLDDLTISISFDEEDDYDENDDMIQNSIIEASSIDNQLTLS